ncbi:MAG TPA: tripartite tricarboxylate transporter substrate binding protein [Burkholderiales bacterium]|nr:tripartite tricarboxylate transporter substrate binding protein [Burkholderiales bacterium]
MRRRYSAGLVFATALSVFSQVTWAQSGGYPNRPVRMIVPSAPGGPADIVGRAVSQGLSDALGQQVVVDNRSGAGGSIGAELVARGVPDGYTVMISHSGPLGIEPLLHAKSSYDPAKDFAPISLVAASPYLLLVNPSVQAKSVKELIALARSRPGKLNYASGGPGTGIHMAAELFNLVADVKVTHVPYKGAGPGMTALMSGEVDMMFNGISSALPQVRAGKIRALAVASAKRSALLPDLPAISESGLTYDTSGWYGFVAPRGTPGPIVAKLHADVVKALNARDMKERLSGLGIEAIGTTPAQFATFLREELAKWSKVIKAAGIKAE